ncbi:MAG TPA: VWA domain-containing protein [Thermoanaerobaculia bacterium]|nr:VWA domain-containing protein [Thermoanaerobaculia bacterium]
MRTTIAITALLFAATALAQRKLVETIEVNVVNVDVVVTDKDGNRIHGLTKDAFELTEDKVPQTITNFYEVRDDAKPSDAAAAPAEQRHRRFAFFIDNDSLHPSLRKDVIASLRKFVDANFRPGDEASIISFNRAPRIVAPLISDKAAILKAIDAVAKEGSPVAIKTELARVEQTCIADLQMAKSSRLLMRSAYDDCIGTVGQETAGIAMSSKRMLAAIEVTLATLNSGAQAKKVLVVAGARLPARPGLELYQWANQLFSQYLTGFNRPNERPAAEPQEDLIENVARLANADGVTMYLLHAPYATDTAAIQNAVAVSDNGADFLAASATAESYQTLARMTGGIMVSRPSNFDLAFDAIARDLASYYSLGYRPADSSARHRNISVRVKRGDYIVRARQTYAPKTPDEQFSDRVTANVFSATPTPEWPITVRTGKPVPDGKNFKVPVEVTIPSTITLLPQGGNTLAGGFTVYIAVGNESGALSDVARRPQPVTVEKSGEADLRREPFRFTLNLTVRPGQNWLSIGVVDQVASTTGLGRATIVAR